MCALKLLQKSWPDLAVAASLRVSETSASKTVAEETGITERRQIDGYAA